MEVQEVLGAAAGDGGPTDSCAEGNSDGLPAAQPEQHVGADVNRDKADDSLRPELDIMRMKKGSSCEVRCDGEWWECEVVDVDIEKQQVLVHYVGGTEDENEWVKVNPERIQLSPLIEIVWARIKHGPKASNQDGKSQDWPAVVIEGSLRDSFCKKLKVFHLLHMTSFRVPRSATTPFTADSIPKEVADESLEHAIIISKRAMQYGKLPESVLSSIKASCEEDAKTAKRSSSSKPSRQSGGGGAEEQGLGGRGKPVGKKVVEVLDSVR